MKKHLLKTAVTSCALALASVSSVNATPTAALRYSIDGNNWTVVADNSAGDIGVAGSIEGFMSVDVLIGTWSLHTTVSQTKPTIGSAAKPVLSVNVSGTTTGSEATKLWIEFSDLGFTPLPIGSFYTSVGGNLANGNMDDLTSSVTSGSNLFGDNDNILTAGASTRTTLTALTGVTGTPFMEAGYAAIPGTLTAPYVITLSHVFTSGGSEGIVSANGRVVSVPDGGSSLVLLGLSVLGLAGFRRKA